MLTQQEMQFITIHHDRNRGSILLVIDSELHLFNCHKHRKYSNVIADIDSCKVIKALRVLWPNCTKYIDDDINDDKIQQCTE